jgi:serine/threonine protein kinase
VKPANILLADGVERVKLTDFGLARAADDASLTKTGIIAGTPQYMSPEQARGDSVDERSDLFSLGCVLYAMCTGRPPFRAETTYGILRRVTDEEPRSIREINPEIPEWLERIVSKLLSKSPGDRFASAAEVHDLLEGCLAHVQQPLTVPLPASCRPPSRSCRFRHAGIFLAACLALLGGWAIRAEWLSHNQSPSNRSSDIEPQPVGSPQNETTPSPVPDVKSDDRDPAAWDATVEDIENLNEDLSPFEIRSQKLWDDPTQTIEE